MTLTPHPWQTAAVDAYERLGGVFVGLDPGAGKTWTAAAIARRCRRPLVVAPAAAIPQTMLMFREYGVRCELAKHGGYFTTPTPPVAFASYTWLQQSAQADFFQRFRPSDVLMDEFHEVRKVFTNSAAKRAERWLMEAPATRVGVFTGSPMTQLVTDFGHGLTWALRGHVRGLVPPTRSGLEMLAERLDGDAAARAGFYSRLVAQPGVFLDSAGAGAYSGKVELRLVRRAPTVVLNDAWELPDGYMLVGAAQAAAMAKMLAWGYWPQVTPRPTERYLDARRAWARTVRDVVGTGAADTESQVRVLRPEAWAAFDAVESDEPLGTHETVWVDDAPLRATLFDHVSADRPTIVWAYHRGLQQRAAEILRCPWHGPGGVDASGVRLEDSRARLVVASIEACHQSLNAQHFSHNVILEPQADPEIMKQLIGRTARQGQTSPSVTVDLVVNSNAAENALRASVVRARLVQQTTGKTNPILGLEKELGLTP